MSIFCKFDVPFLNQRVWGLLEFVIQDLLGNHHCSKNTSNQNSLLVTIKIQVNIITYLQTNISQKVVKSALPLL